MALREMRAPRVTLLGWVGIVLGVSAAPLAMLLIR